MKMDLSGATHGATHGATQEVKETRSERVRRMVVEVEQALQHESAAQVSSRFAEYQIEFPKIFQMLLTRTYPRELLEMMLKNLEKMETGTMSQHNASVAVGGVLVDTYIKPQLKHIPPNKK